MKPTDRLMGKNRLVLHSILTNMMKWNIYLHILQFLHFTDNRDGDDTKEGNCDRLWEIQGIFEILNRTFSRFHNPLENMATDEVIVLFRGMIYSVNIFPRSTNIFVSNYTNYTTGYTKVCLGKDRKSMVAQLTATHTRVAEIIRKAEGHGHKLYKTITFLPRTSRWLTKKKVIC